VEFGGKTFVKLSLDDFAFSSKLFIHSMLVRMKNLIDLIVANETFNL
jgi:hypothetical protein